MTSAQRISKVDRYRRERSDRLDGLLRKITKVGGIDHLSPEEMAYLNRVSVELADELGQP